MRSYLLDYEGLIVPGQFVTSTCIWTFIVLCLFQIKEIKKSFTLFTQINKDSSSPRVTLDYTEKNKSAYLDESKVLPRDFTLPLRTSIRCDRQTGESHFREDLSLTRYCRLLSYFLCSSFTFCVKNFLLTDSLTTPTFIVHCNFSLNDFPVLF